MPTFDEAIRKSVKAFYEGATFSGYEKLKGSSSEYSLEYFDDIESSLRKKSTRESLEEDLEFKEDEDILEEEEE